MRAFCYLINCNRSFPFVTSTLLVTTGVLQCAAASDPELPLGPHNCQHEVLRGRREEWCLFLA